MSNVNQTIIPVELVDNVLNPISEATGMPNQAYTSEEYFTFERDQVFGNTWYALVLHQTCLKMAM